MQLASRFASRSLLLRSDYPLSDDQIRRVAPSIFADAPHESRSERYSYIPTAAVLTELRKEGFLPRVLGQDLALTPVRLEFSESRAKQADIVSRWSWMSPGLALVLYGEKLAGTDAASYSRYVNAVDSFEHQWRQFLIPRVMNRQGLPPEQLRQLPQFPVRNTISVTLPLKSGVLSPC